MDTTQRYREIVKRVLSEYAAIPYAHGEIDRQPVFDEERDHYLLMIAGWDKFRVHGCIIHIDLIDGKVWIQRDNTDFGIASDLERGGIPKEHIVLAFRRPELRKHTEYAVA